MRTFEKTHPWINFRASFREAAPRLWLMLGECQSKCEHIAGVPLRPQTADQLYRVYLAKGALATTAIEGNTLSEKEVLQHLEGKLRLPRSREYLAQEIDNIVMACNQIFEQMPAGEKPPLTAERICTLNKEVLKNLALEEGVIPGQVRTHSVGVGRYKGAPPEDCAFLLEGLAGWLAGEDFRPQPGMEIVYAILKAVLGHLYLAWIHPFGDGNGRTARLVEYQILLSSGVPAPAAHLLSNHYNLTRTEYYRQLEMASRSGGEVLPFVNYAVEGFRDGLRSQLQLIREQQWDITWRNYVHEAFRDRTSRSDIRRRHLVLDLSRREQPATFEQLREVSPRVAAAYASKTRKTLSRDMNALIEEMQLVERTVEGLYRAKKDLILAFLPPRT